MTLPLLLRFLFLVDPVDFVDLDDLDDLDDERSVVDGVVHEVMVSTSGLETGSRDVRGLG